MNLNVLKEVQSAMTRHHEEWKDCEKCAIGKQAFKHVFARGTLPCDVLFIGEAPGKTEDVVGFPFVGKAGKKILDSWIEYSMQEFEYEHPNAVCYCGQSYNEHPSRENHPPIIARGNPDSSLTWAITNIVLCRPSDEPNGPNRPPTGEEAINCRPRLIDFILRIAKPKALVLLGKIASQYSPEWAELPTFQLAHPAWVLRQGGAGSSADIINRNALSTFLKKELYAQVIVQTKG